MNLLYALRDLAAGIAGSAMVANADLSARGTLPSAEVVGPVVSTDVAQLTQSALTLAGPALDRGIVARQRPAGGTSGPNKTEDHPPFNASVLFPGAVGILSGRKKSGQAPFVRVGSRLEPGTVENLQELFERGDGELRAELELNHLLGAEVQEAVAKLPVHLRATLSLNLTRGDYNAVAAMLRTLVRRSVADVTVQVSDTHAARYRYVSVTGLSTSKKTPSSAVPVDADKKVTIKVGSKLEWRDSLQSLVDAGRASAPKKGVTELKADFELVGDVELFIVDGSIVEVSALDLMTPARVLARKHGNGNFQVSINGSAKNVITAVSESVALRPFSGMSRLFNLVPDSVKRSVRAVFDKSTVSLTMNRGSGVLGRADCEAVAVVLAPERHVVKPLRRLFPVTNAVVQSVVAANRAAEARHPTQVTLAISRDLLVQHYDRVVGWLGPVFGRSLNEDHRDRVYVDVESDTIRVLLETNTSDSSAGDQASQGWGPDGRPEVFLKRQITDGKIMLLGPDAYVPHSLGALADSIPENAGYAAAAKVFALRIGMSARDIARSINQAKPWTIGAGAGVIAFGLSAWMLSKSGTVNSGVDVASLVDSSLDSAAAIVGPTELSTPAYLNGITLPNCATIAVEAQRISGETCYTSGGTYYQNAAQNPDYARVGDVFKDLNPSEQVLFSLLLMSGMGLLFLASNRQTLTQIARELGALPAMMGRYRRNSRDEIAAEYFKVISKQFLSLGLPAVETTAILATLLYASAVGLDRSVANNMGLLTLAYYGVKIFSHEYSGAFYNPNPNIPFHLSLPKTILWALGYFATYAAFREMADSAGFYQFTPEGSPSILDNWTLWDHRYNLPLFAADLGSNAIVAPLYARGGPFMIRTSASVYAAIGHAVATLPNSILRRALAYPFRKVEDEVDGYAGPVTRANLITDKRVVGFTQAEKDGTKAGRPMVDPWWNVVTHMIALPSLGWLAWNGLEAGVDVLGGSSTSPVVDTVFGLVGFTMMVGALDAVRSRHGRGRTVYNGVQGTVATLLNPRARMAFLLGVFTVFGSTTTMGIGAIKAAIQGIQLTPQYVIGWSPDQPDEFNELSLLGRSVTTPWFNRAAMNFRVANWPDMPISTFGFFAPGTLWFSGFDAELQAKQGVGLYYAPVVRAWSVTEEGEARAALLAEMQEMETLVWTAYQNNGYGRPDTLDAAKLNLRMIDEANASVGLDVLTPGRPSFLGADESEGH